MSYKRWFAVTRWFQCLSPGPIQPGRPLRLPASAPDLALVNWPSARISHPLRSKPAQPSRPLLFCSVRPQEQVSPRVASKRVRGTATPTWTWTGTTPWSTARPSTRRPTSSPAPELGRTRGRPGRGRRYGEPCSSRKQKQNLPQREMEHTPGCFLTAACVSVFAAAAFPPTEYQPSSPNGPTTVSRRSHVLMLQVRNKHKGSDAAQSASLGFRIGNG